VDIQPASGYAPNVPAPGESITELAQQHGVSRGDAGGPAGYTSNARSAPERSGVSGTISVFA
jgi:hypothetical protein